MRPAAGWRIVSVPPKSEPRQARYHPTHDQRPCGRRIRHRHSRVSNRPRICCVIIGMSGVTTSSALCRPQRRHRWVQITHPGSPRAYHPSPVHSVASADASVMISVCRTDRSEDRTGHQDRESAPTSKSDNGTRSRLCDIRSPHPDLHRYRRASRSSGSPVTAGPWGYFDLNS